MSEGAAESIDRTLRATSGRASKIGGRRRRGTATFNRNGGIALSKQFNIVSCIRRVLRLDTNSSGSLWVVLLL
jgi:hypothetical protein